MYADLECMKISNALIMSAQIANALDNGTVEIFTHEKYLSDK